MTVVRIAVARFELIVDTPTLAKTAVSPANIADKSAQMSHRIAYHREKKSDFATWVRHVAVSAFGVPDVPGVGGAATFRRCTSRLSM
jgi:hypothetical protein